MNFLEKTANTQTIELIRNPLWYPKWILFDKIYAKYQIWFQQDFLNIHDHVIFVDRQDDIFRINWNTNMDMFHCKEYVVSDFFFYIDS